MRTNAARMITSSPGRTAAWIALNKLCLAHDTTTCSAPHEAVFVQLPCHGLAPILESGWGV
jgi:hypothetical protein